MKRGAEIGMDPESKRHRLSSRVAGSGGQAQPVADLISERQPERVWPYRLQLGVCRRLEFSLEVIGAAADDAESAIAYQPMNRVAAGGLVDRQLVLLPFP